MSKTLKNSFYKNLTFEKLLAAHYRAKKNKRNKMEVMKYELDLENNIINLMDDIKNHKYRIGKYREFKVYEPKMRIIKALPYKDRVVHQWYVEEFMKSFMVKRFIYDSYACIEGKGTHKASLQVQKYMRKMKNSYGDYYIIKCDIRKYFYNINRDILYNILKKYISDKELLYFTRILLENNDEVGIPIGNYTSQYFANIYLNELDHYVKDKLHIKFYIRYMDDFVLLVPTKEAAKDIMNKITKYLNEKLKLELNGKSRYYPSRFGCNFCGYIIYETHILLRDRYKKKMKKNVRKWNKINSKGNINVAKTRLQWNSCLGHASHADSYNFMNRMYKNIECHDFLRKPL